MTKSEALQVALDCMYHCRSEGCTSKEDQEALRIVEEMHKAQEEQDRPKRRT